MSSKNIVRAQMLTARSELGPDKIRQFNRDISKNLSFIWVEGGGLSSGSTENKPVWGGYRSFRWEADPQQAITESAPYLRWAFPRLLNDKKSMEFFEPKPTDALWNKNSYGIWEPEPATSIAVDLQSCVGILVPGVAFDRQGHRLGYGKGYYDRALAGFKGLKVGVCFSMQVTGDTLPFDDSDVNMDIIVTDNAIIHVNRPQQ